MVFDPTRPPRSIPSADERTVSALSCALNCFLRHGGVLQEQLLIELRQIATSGGEQQFRSDVEQHPVVIFSRCLDFSDDR